MYHKNPEENKTNTSIETAEILVNNQTLAARVADALNQFAVSNNIPSINNHTVRGQMIQYLLKHQPQIRVEILRNAQSGILGLNIPAPRLQELLIQSYDALGIQDHNIAVTGSAVTGRNSKATGFFRFQGGDRSDIDTQVTLSSERFMARNNQRSVNSQSTNPRRNDRGIIREKQLFETAHNKVENGEIVEIRGNPIPKKNEALNEAAGREVTHSALNPESEFNRDKHKFKDLETLAQNYQNKEPKLTGYEKAGVGLSIAGGALALAQIAEGVRKLKEGHVLHGSLDLAMGGGGTVVSGSSIIGILQGSDALLQVAEKVGGTLCIVDGIAKTVTGIHDLATKERGNVLNASYNIVKGTAEIGIGSMLIHGGSACLKGSAAVGGVIAMVDGVIEIVDMARSNDNMVTKVMKGTTSGMKIAGGALLAASAVATGTVFGAPAGAVLAIAGGIMLAASAIASWVMMLFRKDGGVVLCYDGEVNLDIKRFYSGPLELDIRVFDHAPLEMDIDQFINEVLAMDIDSFQHGPTELDIRPFQHGELSMAERGETIETEPFGEMTESGFDIQPFEPTSGLDIQPFESTSGLDIQPFGPTGF